MALAALTLGAHHITPLLGLASPALTHAARVLPRACLRTCLLCRACCAVRSEAIILCNMSVPRWPIMFANDAWEKATDIDRDTAVQRGFWEVFKARASPCCAVMCCVVV